MPEHARARLEGVPVGEDEGGLEARMELPDLQVPEAGAVAGQGRDRRRPGEAVGDGDAGLRRQVARVVGAADAEGEGDAADFNSRVGQDRESNGHE